MDILSRSPQQTERVGRALGELAQPGDVYLLMGALGTGKTRLIQGIAKGLGIKAHVTSPSFVLMNEHVGRLTLFHADFYRLGGVDEVVDLGLDDPRYSSGVLAIEWAERGLPALGDEYLAIRLEHVGARERRLRFEPRGERYERLVEAMASELQKHGLMGG